MAYDELLASWGGAFGGPDPAGAYRRYVTAGLSEPPESPWKEAYHGWILGSGAFIKRVRAMVRGEPPREQRRESRLILSLPLSRIIEVVCAFYEIERTELSQAREPPSGASGPGVSGEKSDHGEEQPGRAEGKCDRRAAGTASRYLGMVIPARSRLTNFGLPSSQPPAASRNGSSGMIASPASTNRRYDASGWLPPISPCHAA